MTTTLQLPVPVSFEFFPPNTPVGSEKLKTVASHYEKIADEMAKPDGTWQQMVRTAGSIAAKPEAAKAYVTELHSSLNVDVAAAKTKPSGG